MTNPYPFKPPRRNVFEEGSKKETVNSADNHVDNDVHNADNADSDVDDVSSADSVDNADNVDSGEEFSLEESPEDYIDDDTFVDDSLADDLGNEDFVDDNFANDDFADDDFVNENEDTISLDRDNDAYGGGNVDHGYDYDDKDFAPAHNVSTFGGARAVKGEHGDKEHYDNENYDNDDYDDDYVEEESRGGRHRSEEGGNSKKGIIAGIVSTLVIAGAAATFFVVNDNNKVSVASAADYISYDFEGDVCDDFEELPCEVEWIFNNSKTRGELVKQSIAPGERVSPDEEITLYYSQGREYVEVPNVVGLSKDDAHEQLYRAGLDVTQVTNVDAAAKAGTVTEVSGVEAGAEVPNGTEVQISVANGNVEVPDWTGKTKEFVESQAEGLNVAVSFKEEESESPAGTVISQSVKDESISEGDAVEVVIAKSFDTEQVKVPKVLEKSEEQAQSLLAEAGFRKITTVVVENTKVTERQVTQVIPKEGEEVGTDSDITIIVSEPVNENSDDNENTESNDGNDDSSPRDTSATDDSVES